MPEETPADVGLADARDRGAALENFDGHSSTTKNGSHTSSYCSNTTCASWPTRTDSGSSVTIPHDTRSRSCSGNSTIAITYGGSRPGYQGCWLIVKAWIVPRPDTA